MPTSPRAPAIGLPTLRDSSRASSSPCSSTSVASRRSSRARSAGATARQRRERVLRAGDGRVGLVGAGRLDLGDHLLGRRVEDAPSLPRGLDELLEEALVLACLGMPQHAEGEPLVGILEPLDDAVLGPRDLPQPVADPAEALVVVRLDRAARPADARARDRRARRAPRTRRATSLCSSCPTTSGRCWTRSPPRATLRSCEAPADREHRQVSLERRLEQRELAAVALGFVPVVSGCASAPYRPGSRSLPPEKTSPSRASSISSIPSSSGGTSTARPPARSTART